MRKGICLKCGFCCWHYESVLLTENETERRAFKMEKSKEFSKKDLGGNFSGMIVERRETYVKKLGKIKKICCYFDGNTALCLIHFDKSDSCKRHQCSINFKDNAHERSLA